MTDNAVAAEKLAREYPQYAFVTPEGTCYQGRMVTGGKPDDAGPLGMKRELRAMDAEVMQLEDAMNAMQAELETIVAELRSSEQANEELTAQQRDAERNLFCGETPSRTDAERIGAIGIGLDRVPERIDARAARKSRRCSSARLAQGCSTKRRQRRERKLKRRAYGWRKKWYNYGRGADPSRTN